MTSSGSRVHPNERLNVLFLCALPPGAAGTIRDHVRAFRKYSGHRVTTFPHVGVISNRLPKAIDLRSYDALVLHYSLYLLNHNYLSEDEFDRISAFEGTKVLFLQDEYRDVNHMIAIIDRLRIDILFSCIPEPEIEKVYPSSRLPSLKKISNLTGYVPAPLVHRRVRRIEDRPIDIGYRGRVLPYWLGKLAAEKWQIAEQFLLETKDTGLICDLAVREEERVYGVRWIRFVESCKAVLGVESGASVFDFDGSVRAAVDAYLATNPAATFEDVESRFLRQHEGKIRLNQISPRCFEAAALRTAMVLFEGEYSSVLEPWKNYVPLRKDFSNIREVVDVLKDPQRLQAIADAAYRDVALNPAWSYETLVGRFDQVLSAVHAEKRRELCPPVSRLAFAAAAAPAAVFPLLVRLWLKIPSGLRQKLKPIVQPLIAAIRR